MRTSEIIRSTKRVLRKAKTSLKRESRPSFLTFMLLSVMLALGSSWPIQASNALPESAVQDFRIAMTDSLPPKKTAQPTSKLKDHTITKKALLAQKGVASLLENFDANCKIKGYEVTVVPEGQDPISIRNTGSDFSATTREALQKLIGMRDPVFIDNIEVDCPGDDGQPANIGSLSFYVLSKQ